MWVLPFFYLYSLPYSIRVFMMVGVRTYTLYILFFFFSSRRRHTRSDRDWSSDVCSSDLLLTMSSISLHVRLNGKEIDDMVKSGQAVSAKFVIPYPPGFPIMVPGQVITKEIGRASCRERV